MGVDPWVEKIPWRRTWQPTPVFLPGKSHGQRSLAGSESDTTEHHTHSHLHFIQRGNYDPVACTKLPGLILAVGPGM